MDFFWPIGGVCSWTKIYEGQIMLFKQLPWIVFNFIALGFSPQIFAQEKNTIKQVDESNQDLRFSGHDFYIGVLGAGLFSLSNDTNLESDKFGYLFGGSALVNYYNPIFSLDLSIGWMTSEVSGDAVLVTDEEKKDKNNVNVNIAFSDLNIHYRVNPRWDVGLATKVTFGGESSYSPFTENKSKAPNVYVGAQVLRSVVKQDYRMRYGAQIMTDVTEKDRQVSWAGLIFQIGILDTKSTGSDGKNEYVEKVVEVEKYLFVLDSYLVNFEVKKSKLLPESEKFLRELGRLLLSRRSQWSSLEIDGHTDKNGDFNFNQVLSVERADSAKDIFVQIGISGNKITTRGFGLSKPLDTGSDPVALARNRRVEITINGLTNQELIKKINELKQKMATPKTCNDGICN